jgi:hypothetical protein
MTSVFCKDKTCPYYGHFWFFHTNELNQVTHHTHTLYEGPATDDQEQPE